MTQRSPSKATGPMPDHRVAVAAKKRQQMRARLIDATLQVFSDAAERRPVIEDVARQAQVSRATFYEHFDSIEAALVAVGQMLSERIATDSLPVYDVLKEPWKRFAVGFRGFLTMALVEPTWAGFIIRMDVWPQESLVARLIARDVRLGLDSGDFRIASIEMATDFLMGATIGCIQALRLGVPDPQSYIDGAVEAGLRSLGCDPEHCEQGVRFSRRHLDGWSGGCQFAE